jgi:hypothetical protein
MADDRYDQLLQIRQQANHKMAEQAIQQIANEYQSNTQWDDAAYHARELKRLEAEAAPYVRAAQQQQQQQYTQAEQELLRSYPDIARDPKKWNTALAAANNLILRGYDRNSTEYIQAIAYACDVLNADMTESNEVASPDEALRACQSKYGAVTADEYNRGVERLKSEKAAGMRSMSQT